MSFCGYLILICFISLWRPSVAETKPNESSGASHPNTSQENEPPEGSADNRKADNSDQSDELKSAESTDDYSGNINKETSPAPTATSTEAPTEKKTSESSGASHPNPSQENEPPEGSADNRKADNSDQSDELKSAESIDDTSVNINKETSPAPIAVSTKAPTGDQKVQNNVDHTEKHIPDETPKEDSTQHLRTNSEKTEIDGDKNPSKNFNGYSAKNTTTETSETTQPTSAHSVNYTAIMSVTLALTGATLFAVIILICNRKRICRNRFWVSTGIARNKRFEEPVVTYQRFV